MYACINVIERNKFRMFPFMLEHDVSADGPSFRRTLDSGDSLAPQIMWGPWAFSQFAYI